MAKKSTTSLKRDKKSRPALTPEAREAQIASAAYDLAEQQILDGTASSQVITHFLKIASTREKLSMEKEIEEIKLLTAKREALDQQRIFAETMEEAIKVFKGYRGETSEE